MDHKSSARSLFFGIHLMLQSVLSSSCTVKPRHRTSLVRKLGSKLPLGPARRLHLHPELFDLAKRSVSPTSDTDSELIWKTPTLVSLADIPWLIEEVLESGIRLRVQMYLPPSISSTSEAQESAETNLASCCQCHRPITPCNDSAICDSALSTGSHDQESLSRIAEMEAELSKLRHQLAMLVMAQENGTEPLPRAMTSSPISTSTRTYKPVNDPGLISCLPPPPPPPPLPPPPELLAVNVISIKDIIRQNKVKSGKNTGNGTRISMDQVLKDMGTVQLRKIARSPGGTPMRVVRDSTDSDHTDPAALIARALRKKFASQKHVEQSPGSESASSPGNRSVCWSPESSIGVIPPTPLFGRHLLKPVSARNCMLSSGSPLCAVSE